MACKPLHVDVYIHVIEEREAGDGGYGWLRGRLLTLEKENPLLSVPGNLMNLGQSRALKSKQICL